MMRGVVRTFMVMAALWPPSPVCTVVQLLQPLLTALNDLRLFRVGEERANHLSENARNSLILRWRARLDLNQGPSA